MEELYWEISLYFEYKNYCTQEEYYKCLGREVPNKGKI